MKAALLALHRTIRDLADDMTNGQASETRDLDSYLQALIRAVLDRKVPCHLEILNRLRDLARAEGFE